MSLQLRTLMLALMVFCIGSSNALAKTIKLYDQPKADAKVVDTLNTESGFIYIFNGFPLEPQQPRDVNQRADPAQADYIADEAFCHR